MQHRVPRPRQHHQRASEVHASCPLCFARSRPKQSNRYSEDASVAHPDHSQRSRRRRTKRTSRSRCTTRSCLSQPRSEEHTSELQSLMRISYAVFCLKKKLNIIIISICSLLSLCYNIYSCDDTL